MARAVIYRITRRGNGAFDVVITTTTGRTFKRRGLKDLAAAKAALGDLKDILAVLGLVVIAAGEVSKPN